MLRIYMRKITLKSFYSFSSVSHKAELGKKSTSLMQFRCKRHFMILELGIARAKKNSKNFRIVKLCVFTLQRKSVCQFLSFCGSEIFSSINLTNEIFYSLSELMVKKILSMIFVLNFGKKFVNLLTCRLSI